MNTVEEILKSLNDQLAEVEVLDREDACREEIEAIYANFDDEKARKIAEIKTTIELISKTNENLDLLKAETEPAETESPYAI